MHMATPIKVWIFMELFTTILTSLNTRIDLSFSIPQPDNPLSHFFFLICK
jgi:hypothetical protein